MVLVLDGNTIWRVRPFVALAENLPVKILCPGTRIASKGHSLGRFIVLPPGWATRTGALSQAYLWWRIGRLRRRESWKVSTVVFTIPHYKAFLRWIPAGVQKIYYCSDDYALYEGWGGEEMARKERRFMKRMDQCVFVSKALGDRVTQRAGRPDLDWKLSMNATEERFLGSAECPGSCPQEGLARPIAGVIGGINERLDYELLVESCGSPALGTLLLVGPLPEHPGPALVRLLAHPKCVAVGAVPHEELHQWFHCLDAGLIPYRKSPFNEVCSPMRFFDHLASGAPIVATDACRQLGEFSESVQIADTDPRFVEALTRLCEEGQPAEARERQIRLARQHTWQQRAEQLRTLLKQKHES